MEKIRRNFTILLTFILLVLAWGAWYFLMQFYPQFYFSWYPSIPVFFYVIGNVFIQTITRTQTENPRKIANTYLLMKIAKNTVSFLFLGALLLMEGRNHIREFLMVFAIYYFIYLGIETLILLQTEKEIKRLNAQ